MTKQYRQQTHTTSNDEDLASLMQTHFNVNLNLQT